MRLFLVDDEPARCWAPFRTTRPVGELLFGCLLLRERAERYWDAKCAGHLAGAELEGFEEPGAPRVVEMKDVITEEARIFVSSRFVPSGTTPPEPEEATTFVVDGEVAARYVPGEAPNPDSAEPLTPPGSGERTEDIPGRILKHPWDLVVGNPERIRGDIPVLFPHSHAFLPPHVDQIGDDHAVSVARDVELEPGVVLDSRPGPIRLSSGVRVRAGSRLEGPMYVGPGASILGGSLSAVSLGPVTKVRGEVEESVILGYSNKAHDGFLGHAYLGRWVNLGAMTTNSDLKNTYGTVRIRTRDHDVDTGLLKLGCLLGDHVKTGIGTLLNTGTMVGAGSNLFGPEMPPKYVPPFAWGRGDELTEHRLEDFLRTTAMVMARRNQELGEGLRRLLRRAWEATRGQREAV